MKLEEVSQEAADRLKRDAKKSYLRFELVPHLSDRKTVITTTEFYAWLVEHREEYLVEAVKGYTGINLDTHRLSEYDVKTLRIIHDYFWCCDVRSRSVCSKQNEQTKQKDELTCGADSDKTSTAK